MKTLKRMISVLLLCTLLVGMLSTTAFADKRTDAFDYIRSYVKEHGEARTWFGSTSYIYMTDSVGDWGMSCTGPYISFTEDDAGTITVYGAAMEMMATLTLKKGADEAECYLTSGRAQENVKFRLSDIRHETILHYSSFQGTAEEKADVEGYVNAAFHRGLGLLAEILKTGGYAMSDLGFKNYQPYSGVCHYLDACPGKAFRDMPAGGTWAHDPIDWAVSNNITNGTSKTTFSPDRSCTRGQIVTFLWRASGCPKAENVENPFADVAESDYYYDAVLWAVSKGITSGTSETKFSPDHICTRAQVVTFIWRTAEKPEPGDPWKVYEDVPEGMFYSDAVTWAVSHGITAGVSDTRFAPDSGCTRAQVVTFLFRYCGRF